MDPKYKPARYHLLYAVRLLTTAASLPAMNASAMDAYCAELTDVLWDQEKSDAVFNRAVEAMDVAVEGREFSRDAIRTQPFTESVASACGLDAVGKGGATTGAE